jgi:hypothetical protein
MYVSVLTDSSNQNFGRGVFFAGPLEMITIRK